MAIKMGKRRRSEDSVESNTLVKKELPEFNGTAFKAMLKEPSTAMKGECTLLHPSLIGVNHPLTNLPFIS